MAAARTPVVSRLASAVALAWLVTLAASDEVDPTSWVPDQCQCDAEESVAALCTQATFYPPDIAAAEWETIGDQYVSILEDASLTDQQREERYLPLMQQTGLEPANFTMYAAKYAAWVSLPTAEQIRSKHGYCSVSYGDHGLVPCLCLGGAIVELSLSLVDPVPIEFTADEEAAKQRVITVLGDRLSDSLGMWYSEVAMGGHASGDDGGTTATIHVTMTTRDKTKLEERYSSIEALLGQPGELSTADDSTKITLGASNLDLKVPVCAGPVTPTTNLPAEATPTSQEDILAGTWVNFRCPEQKKFSTGGAYESRRCGADRQLQPKQGLTEPLTCVDQSVTAAPTEASSTTGQSTSPSSQVSTRSTTTYVPDQYEQIDVDWNDGDSIRKVDPNKPNLLLRITIPAASVIFVFLVLYLLCTRPESCMCNVCGGGKMDEVA